MTVQTKKSITIRFDLEDYTRLAEFATEDRREPREMAKKIILDWLDEQEKVEPASDIVRNAIAYEPIKHGQLDAQ